MSLKISEMILQRKDQAKDLSAGVSACIDEIAAGYSAYLTHAVGEGEPPVDTRQQLELVQRSIGLELEALEGRDDKVVDKHRDNTMGSQDINVVADKVVAKMRYVRNACRAFGPDGMERSSTKDEFPSRPLKIYERADMMQTSLRSSDLGLKPKIEIAGSDGDLSGIAPDPLKLADLLEPEKSELGELLNERYLDKRQGLDFRSYRQKGIRKFDKNMRGLVRIIQGTLLLAGRDDLVDRFSTKLRRFTRRPAPALAADAIESSTAEVAAPSESESAASSESAQD